VNHHLKTKSCANFANGICGISFPPKLPYFEEKQSECKKHERNNKFVGIKIPKFQEVRKWVLQPCLENMKTGHPPTVSILATDQAFDSLIHISLATNPRLWHWLWSFFHNPYVDGHKIRCSHGICKLHMKMLEMGSGNSSIPFYWPWLVRQGYCVENHYRV
jgi:hypothetical protein